MASNPVKRKTLDKTQNPEQRCFCSKCGRAFSRAKGYFPVSHSPMYRGTGYLPWCNDCVEDMYDYYVGTLKDDRAAMRRVCMKLDLYWSDAIFDMVERTAGFHSRVRNYIGKTNLIKYIDKSYDDTITEEEKLVSISEVASPNGDTTRSESQNLTEEERGEFEEGEELDISEVPEDVVLFWGPGYKPDMYLEMEQRRKFWESSYPEGYKFTVGEHALIRQVCNLEIDIAHDRSAGKSIDKSVNALNTLIGSMNLKPAQQKVDDAESEFANMPFGVGIRKWENTRPIPTPDPEFQDVDNIVKYITVWFLGHLCKMLGIKNSYCKLYEEEMERLRVSKPEFEDEDDETVFNNIFTSDEK